MDARLAHRVEVRPESLVLEPLPAAEPLEGPAAWRTSGHEAQVFVDDSGRRARRVRLAGFALAGACAFWLAALTLGVVGFAGFPTQLPKLARTAGARLVPPRTEAVADQRETAAPRRKLVYVDEARAQPSCSSRSGGRLAAGAATALAPARGHAGRKAPRAACASGVDRDPRLT
jgi:hypothetical protein